MAGDFADNDRTLTYQNAVIYAKAMNRSEQDVQEAILGLAQSPLDFQSLLDAQTAQIKAGLQLDVEKLAKETALQLHRISNVLPSLHSAISRAKQQSEKGDTEGALRIITDTEVLEAEEERRLSTEMSSLADAKISRLRLKAEMLTTLGRRLETITTLGQAIEVACSTANEGEKSLRFWRQKLFNAEVNSFKNQNDAVTFANSEFVPPVAPDTVTFSILINKSLTFEKGRSLLAEMKAAGVTPDEFTYNTLITLSRDFEIGRSLLAEMKAAGATPNEFTYSTLITLSRDFEKGRSLLAEMKAAGVTPNEFTYSTLITLSRDFEIGRSLLAEMKAAGVTPDEFTYSTLITLSRDFEIGRSLLAEMKAAGVTPNEVTYSTLIDFARNYTQAKSMYEEMKQKGVAADKVTFSNLIKLSPTYKDAYSYFREMIRKRIKVDAQACFTLMRKTDNYDVNRSILVQSCKFLGMQPDVFLYTRLISLAPDALSAAGNYQEMLNKGIQPNSYTKEALAKHGL
jgi:hypothetical protein